MHPDFESVPHAVMPLDKKRLGDLRADLKPLFSDESKPIPVFEDFLTAVIDLSPFLKSCLLAEADFISRLLKNGFEKSAEDILSDTGLAGKGIKEEAEFMKAVRVAKRQMALLCGLADLGGWWNGEKVTLMLSAFARSSLAACIDFTLLQYQESEKLTLPDSENPQSGSGLIVLGMGKLGAGELNYSSDIDLILFYDKAAPIILNTDDPVTLLSRMARLLIKLMQERTGDGYVFRMDLRLRPDPSSTPLVIPLEAALNYYEGQGQNWERAAMIKAVPVAGDITAGQSFMKELEPFIWRKYLDFAAINDVQSIKRQIHAHKGHGEIAVLGHNIKLGRGGIREIEFFAQTQQLIAGGRNPDLRVNRTIAALHALADHDWIEQEAAEDLSEAYWFLRDLEHRLQMVADEQTHTLPEDNEELRRIAYMFGEADVDAFSNRIHSTLAIVERHYAELFESAPGLGGDSGNLVFTGDDNDPETLKTLDQMGFSQPELVMKTVKSWHVARIPALRTTQARELLTELIPGLLKSFAATSKPDDVMVMFDRFLSGLPAGIQLFAILKTNPALGDLLLRILSAAPRLGEQIAQRPHVFDGMIDPQFSEALPEKAELLEILKNSLERASAYEAALDEARRFFAQTRFLIGCQHLSGSFSLERTAQAFTTLAEVMVTGILELVQREFEKRHGKVADSQICILGMGRLGSRELTSTSDLDLIFLYNYDEASEYSDGEKQLPASLYFIRLIQRFIAAMSSPTGEGVIYELDFRLRPSGNAGPLATHLDAFMKYQREDAWVWEAQALTRARPIAGDEALCRKVEQELPLILADASKDKDLCSEIGKMRAMIEKEKGSKDPWNVKLVSGGMLDVEFIAQWLALENRSNSGLTGTREILLHPDVSQLNEASREKLVKAVDLYASVMQIKRICVGSSADVNETPKGFKDILCSALDLPDIAACEAHLTATQHQVRELFTSLMKGKKNPEP